MAGTYAGGPDPGPPAGDIEAHLGAERPAVSARRRRVLAAKALDLLPRLPASAPKGPAAVPLRLAPPLRARPPAPEAATVTDVLVAALSMAVDGWNAEHGVPTRRIGLLMPVNLRPARGEPTSSPTSCWRRGSRPPRRDPTSPQAIVDRVAAQTRRIKQGDARR